MQTMKKGLVTGTRTGPYGMQASYLGTPMSQFKAGDLCEVVDHPKWGAPYDQGKKYIGRQVILIRLYVDDDDRTFDPWMPRWIVSGIGKGVNFSEKILRKIEPPALDEEESQDLELVV